MPALSYTVSDFLPFTKILSADVNSRFNDIKTLLNTTKLDSTNIQQYGLTRDRLAAGTASHVVINDGSGYMSSEAQLSTTRGGLGFAPTISSGNAGKVVGVNDSGAALELRSPESATIVEQFANDVATITAGENITANDAVCLSLNEGAYKVFQADADGTDRSANFIGFAKASATTTAQVTDLTKGSSWTVGTVSVTINNRVYSQAFSASNDTSMTSLATALSADPDVASAAVQGGSPYNTVRVTGRGGLTLTITSSSSGGAPTLTPSTTTSPSGQSVRIQMFGPMSGFSSLVVGDLYYLSTTAGGITNAPSVASPVLVGQAISSTVLLINPNKFDYVLTSNSILIKAFGSTDTTENNSTSTVEHFSTFAWSTGTTDSETWSHGGNSNSAYNNLYHKGDGRYSGGARNGFKSYNKNSWSSLTNRGTNSYNYGMHSFNSFLYLNGGNNGGAQAYAHKWNGSSWNTGATAWSYSGEGQGNFVVGVLLSCLGSNSPGANTHNTRTTADSVSSATAQPYTGGGMTTENAPGSLGFTVSGTAAYTWNGSSWSSSITASVSCSPDYCGTTGYLPTKGKVYISNGYNGATAYASTQTFTGTAFSSDTASSSARCMTGGAAF